MTLCQTVRSTNDNSDTQTSIYVHTNKKHRIHTEKQDISNKKILFNLVTDDGSTKDSWVTQKTHSEHNTRT